MAFLYIGFYLLIIFAQFPSKPASSVGRRVHRPKVNNVHFQDYKILKGLLKNYDARIRPPTVNPIPGQPGKGPVLVKVNILIRMLSKIDVVNMEYQMQITFRERWVDRRLSYEHMNISNRPKFMTFPHGKELIWLPDTFFPTEKQAHRHMVARFKNQLRIDSENMFLRIYPNGTILYSARLSLTCSCPMQLQLYPLDIQHCDFDLISYAFTTKDIVYEWDTNNEPVQKKPGVGKDLPNFHLADIDTGVECTSHTNTGTYACLRMRLKLSRLMAYFVFQLYLPTGMIVIVSWVSFWIDMHSTAGRIALSMTTLLTITTMQSSINAKLPPVNYVKVVDVWLGTCQTFVFGALIEYAVVCYRDTQLRLAKTKKVAAELRKSQRRRPNQQQQSSSTMAEKEHLQSLAGHYWDRILTNDDPWELPCTCELGGIGGAVLASLGFVPDVSHLSTLVPLSMETMLTQDRKSSAACSNGRAISRDKKSINFSPAKVDFSLPSRQSFLTLMRRKLRKPDYMPARIDYYARILMPLSFVVFNLFYWSISLYMAAQQYRAKVQ